MEYFTDVDQKGQIYHGVILYPFHLVSDYIDFIYPYTFIKIFCKIPISGNPGKLFHSHNSVKFQRILMGLGGVLKIHLEKVYHKHH